MTLVPMHFLLCKDPLYYMPEFRRYSKNYLVRSRNFHSKPKKCPTSTQQVADKVCFYKIAVWRLFLSSRGPLVCARFVAKVIGLLAVLGALIQQNR